MGNIFAGSEIVELGIQIEKNGRDFYRALAVKSKSATAAEQFEFLAAEEERHISAFTKILEETRRYQPQGLDSDEYFAYMNSLAGEYIFTQQDKGGGLAAKAGSDKEAVELGIGFEKESIIFYQGMKKVVPDYDLKIVDEVISQEEKHLKMLSELKNTL